jgi:hypothetical protein
MAPRGDLCSTGYCLVRPGREYLLYQPKSGQFSVDLSAAPGARFSLEWADPFKGRVSEGADLAGGAVRTVAPPFGGPAVAYLRRR